MILELIKPLSEWTGLDLVPLLLVGLVAIGLVLLVKKC